jgi:LSD1 subclass zinc finger protein
MRVRCGACRTQFEVPGAGRFACPVCGSVNVVRDANGGNGPDDIGGYPAAPGVGGAGAPPPPPPPPEPDAPMPKIKCPECDFTFIVGKIATATCPNCGNEVDTGIEEETAE